MQKPRLSKFNGQWHVLVDPEQPIDYGLLAKAFDWCVDMNTRARYGDSVTGWNATLRKEKAPE